LLFFADFPAGGGAAGYPVINPDLEGRPCPNACRAQDFSGISSHRPNSPENSSFFFSRAGQQGWETFFNIFLEKSKC